VAKLKTTQGAYSTLTVGLDPGEKFVSESGLFVSGSGNIDIDVTAKPKGQGGLLGGLKRLVSGDSFFMSTYTAENGPGEVLLAPVLPGEVKVVELDGSKTWMCAGASFMACGPDVALDTKFQGLSGLFSGESFFFVEASGRGPLVVGAFGQVRELVSDGDLVIDTGHLVAFEAGMEYRITKAGGSWISSWLAGEGFVMRFSGKGRVLVQSHNPKEFGREIGPMLPPRG
jgi:uncharacterized protein (TIGR00266 family)